MASGVQIGEDVTALIRDHIHSIEQLDILLLLRSDPSRAFSERDVAHQLRTGLDSSAARLKDLAHRGFLSQRVADGGFQYAPCTEALAAAVSSLAKAYSERRYTVIRLVFDKPIDKVRTFADAFRIRGPSEDENGR